MIIGEILTSLVMRGLKKSIRKRAHVTSRGMSGGVGIAISALPFLVGLLFTGFACFAMKDPDPEDQRTGWIVLSLGGISFLLFLHYLTYRVTITDSAIHVGSLLTGERTIAFDQVFDVSCVDDKVLIHQAGKSISLYWFMNGYQELKNVLIEKDLNWEDDEN